MVTFLGVLAVVAVACLAVIGYGIYRAYAITPAPSRPLTPIPDVELVGKPDTIEASGLGPRENAAFNTVVDRVDSLRSIT